MLNIEKIKNVRMYRFDAVGFHEAGRSQAPCEQKDLGISWHYFPETIGTKPFRLPEHDINSMSASLQDWLPSENTAKSSDSLQYHT